MFDSYEFYAMRKRACHKQGTIAITDTISLLAVI